MTLNELRSLTRIRLDDIRLPYLWSDDELNIYINQAIDEAAIRSRNIVDSTTAICCSINVIAGTADYSVHPAVFFVDRVYDANQKLYLQKTSFNELDSCYGQWQDTTGTPTHYFEDNNHFGADCSSTRSIRLYPVPISDTTLNMTVYRVPLRKLDSDESCPELPSFVHPDLIFWALHLAYMKQDADTFDAEKSLNFGAVFEGAFGPKQSARLLEYRRKHRPMRVAGQYI